MRVFLPVSVPLKKPRSALWSAPLLALLLSACASTQAPAPRGPASLPKPQPTLPQPIPQPQPRPLPTPAPVLPRPEPAPTQQSKTAPVELESRVHEAWRTFSGRTGIAVQRIDGEWLAGKRQSEYFPQQSVSKLWVAVAILDHIDQGKLSLTTPVRVSYDDFTMFQSVIKARVEKNGPVMTTVGELLELSILKSDNTANDKLADLIGGPEEVRRILSKKGLTGIRFGPGERKLQSDIAGLPWDQSYGPGNRWFEARAKLSDESRRAKMNAYLENPADGATPEGIAKALSQLARGNLLSVASTRHLLGLMERVTSGPNRLKAGVPLDWRFGHKTGTGQTLGGWSTGYNDAGIMTAPDGTRYAVVVMIADTTATIPQRMQMMQAIAKSVAETHR